MQIKFQLYLSLQTDFTAMTPLPNSVLVIFYTNKIFLTEEEK